MKKKTSEISITEAKPLLGRLINRTDKERIILTRFGHPVAALVSMDDLDMLQRLKKLSPFESMVTGAFIGDFQAKPVGDQQL